MFNLTFKFKFIINKDNQLLDVSFFLWTNSNASFFVTYFTQYNDNRFVIIELQLVVFRVFFYSDQIIFQFNFIVLETRIKAEESQHNCDKTVEIVTEKLGKCGRI